VTTGGGTWPAGVGATAKWPPHIGPNTGVAVYCIYAIWNPIMPRILRMSGNSSTGTAEQVGEATKRWTIRGVSSEAREAIVAAADREGSTIGKWINRYAVQATLAGPAQQSHAAAAPAPSIGASLADITQLIVLIRNAGNPSWKNLPRSIATPAERLVRVLRSKPG
jgi:hypothetical protein